MAGHNLNPCKLYMIQLAKSMFHSITLSTSNCQFGRQRIKAFGHYRFNEYIRVIMTTLLLWIHTTDTMYLPTTYYQESEYKANNQKGLLVVVSYKCTNMCVLHICMHFSNRPWYFKWNIRNTLIIDFSIFKNLYFY